MHIEVLAEQEKKMAEPRKDVYNIIIRNHNQKNSNSESTLILRYA